MQAQLLFGIQTNGVKHTHAEVLDIRPAVESGELVLDLFAALDPHGAQA